jgi:4-alpha-glucanotransferase
MLLHLYLRFYTHYGQSLYVCGNCPELGSDDTAMAVPLQYLNNEFWQLSVDLPDAADRDSISYRYLLRQEGTHDIMEWGDDRVIDTNHTGQKELVLVDTWNHAGTIENAFFTQPFQQVLLPKAATHKGKGKSAKTITHELRVKAPLLGPDEVICVCGSGQVLGDWQTDKPALATKKENWWVTPLNFAKEQLPVAYKYGVYNIAQKAFVAYEGGPNRTLPGEASTKKLHILHDGFAQLPTPQWRAAGVAIPVFSLRSGNGFGTGEFTDIRLLADWAQQTGLKLIQLLPVNDTTATHSNADSYPYAAVSAFALHPLFIDLSKLAGSDHAHLLQASQQRQAALNSLPQLDYGAVMEEKWKVIRELYALQKDDWHDDTKYFEFFDMNRHWLVPYAAFCYLRDKHGTAQYGTWPAYSVYNEEEVQELVDPTQPHYDEVAIHYFVQYHLHLQLREATAYAHRKGIIVKGDLPIGIYRYSCDAWVQPELYNMDAQAGAPPDDFAVKGQNWGFPTYNWQQMQADGFSWWRRRFEQMGNYFDAFRIDHILGFFRIWSIPLHAVEGIMGRFVPAIAVHINEFFERGIAFERHRFCAPYITDAVLNELFGDRADMVRDNYLVYEHGEYRLQEAFDTQRKVAAHFEGAVPGSAEANLRDRLYDLISNVLLFEEADSNGSRFHFRIAMDQTSSFRYLDGHSQHQLQELYVNYFFRRQDDFWAQEAMNKLPQLKRSTNMLICGEDLGMVPHCVPDVMEQLGMLSLEIQRMPKQTDRAFLHPADAPYLSVITPSTHDMSTLRGWWQEDRAKTQQFYNTILGHYGEAPFYCEPWINKEMVIQHLYSPAMWSIFQLQDLMGIDGTLRREKPEDERINLPSDPNHYWCYRMHLSLEELLQQQGFNEELLGYVKASGR